MSIGEAFLDHYEHYLHSFERVEKYQIDGTTIQILDFPNAIEEAHVLASLGLSLFSAQLGEVCEVVMPVSEAPEAVSEALAQSLAFLLRLRTPIPEVTYLRHLHRTAPDIFRRYGKSGVAFVPPYLFPQHFETVALPEGRTGHIWLAFLLSEGEIDFAESQGFDGLTDILEAEGIDIVQIDRPSVV